jgi:hypothetical protein
MRFTRAGARPAAVAATRAATGRGSSRSRRVAGVGRLVVPAVVVALVGLCLGGGVLAARPGRRAGDARHEPAVTAPVVPAALHAPAVPRADRVRVGPRAPGRAPSAGRDPVLSGLVVPGTRCGAPAARGGSAGSALTSGPRGARMPPDRTRAAARGRCSGVSRSWCAPRFWPELLPSAVRRGSPPRGRGGSGAPMATPLPGRFPRSSRPPTAAGAGRSPTWWYAEMPTRPG